MHPSNKILHAVCIVLITAVAGACSPVGEKYADVDDIAMSSSWQDWVVVGRFGASGPFELVEIKYCEVSESCVFSHQGQSHSYEKFHGFELAGLRLQGTQNEVAHVVLRSKEQHP